MNQTSSPNDPTRSRTESPLGSQHRIVEVDMLRGLAVMGLMLAHIITFAHPVDMFGDPRGALSYSGANQPFIWVLGVLVQGKFFFLFSLLFGASVMFFDQKTGGERLSDGAGLWYRRMAWLAVIGLAHVSLLFFGDILFFYGLCGMGLLWWLRRLSASMLIGFGGALYALSLLSLFGLMLLITTIAEEMPSAKEHARDQIEANLGSYMDALINRLEFFLQGLIQFPFLSFWLISGIMLAGMGLAKMGILTGQRSTRFYTRLSIIGLGIGLPMSIGLFQWFAASDFATNRAALWSALVYPTAIPVSLGYLGLIMLIAHKGWLRPLQQALAAVGRMALSNYLLHSLFGAVIFQGWALGYYNQLEFPALAAIVALAWASNITFSLVWLHYCRFGPVEWLWRSLTYKRVQPMIK